MAKDSRVCLKFLQNNQKTLEEGMLIGPEIQHLFSDTKFEGRLNSREKDTWLASKVFVRNILRNEKSDNYVETVKDIVKKCNILGYKMNRKLLFLDSHLNVFPEKSERSY